MSKKEKAERRKVSAEELAQIVEREFVANADEKFLKKVLKTAKGGIRHSKTLKSADKRFVLIVGFPFFFFLPHKDVTLIDEADNVIYALEKERYWKAFYTAVKAAVEAKKTV